MVLSGQADVPGLSLDAEADVETYISSAAKLAVETVIVAQIKEAATKRIADFDMFAQLYSSVERSNRS